MFVINKPKEGLVGEQQWKTDASEVRFLECFLSLTRIFSVQNMLYFHLLKPISISLALFLPAHRVIKKECFAINYQHFQRSE